MPELITPLVPSIPERRSQKLATKGMRTEELSPQKVQLPLKDTSDGDPSVLSEVRPASDMVSLEFELGSARSLGRSKTSVTP